MTVLLVAFSVFLSVENTYYLTIFCFPFASILKFSAASYSILPLLYIVIIIKLLFFKRQRLNLLALIFFACFAAMQFLCIATSEAPFAGVISLLLNCFFVIYSATYFAGKSGEDRLLLQYASLFLGVAVALNIALCDLFPNIPYLLDSVKQDALVANNRFAALMMEPNEFSQLVLVTVGFLVATFSSYKTVFGQSSVIILASYLVVNGVRTNSKSYVLTLFALFGALVLFLLIRFCKGKKTAGALLGVMALFVLGIGASYFLVNDVILPVFEYRGQTDDLLTGRGDIWAMYIDAIFQRIDVVFMGCGAGNVSAVLRGIGVVSQVVPHNVYLEYLIQFGVVGLFLLGLSWFKTFKLSRKKGIFFALPLLAFLITSLSISANSNDCIFILFILLSMPLASTTNLKVSQGKKCDVKIQSEKI